jgi:GTP-binding protein
MKPVIALVGRPNVGKSTLFNKLTKSRDALVADFAGLTRDRKYGDGKLGGFEYIVVDTGGLNGESEVLDVRMQEQSWLAVDEADAVVFLVDGRDGLTPVDHEIADRLRRTERPVCLAVNKTDTLDESQVVLEFYELGLAEPHCIAAAHNRGLLKLISAVQALLPGELAEADGEATDDGLRLAVVGRPNVGKSTLINRMLGEERVVAFDLPGTTRDSIPIPFERDGKSYTLIDTAGVRRRGKVSETVEKFSVIKTLQAIEACNVCVLLLDATERVTDQDLNLLGYIIDKGRALIVAVNKWDGLEHEQRELIKSDIARRLDFLDFTRIEFISALHGTGVGKLLSFANRAYESAMIDMSTPQLTRMLEYAVMQHQPPLVRGRRIKMRYAHQGGSNPPVIVVHGNQTQRIPDSYKRYLSNFFQRELKLFGTPVRIDFKTSDNPYSHIRNKLTPLQQRKRNRFLRTVKKK